LEAFEADLAGEGADFDDASAAVAATFWKKLIEGKVSGASQTME
jgi:hypothetical protein